MIMKHWKQPECPATGEWASKLEAINLMDYIIDIKSKSHGS